MNEFEIYHHGIKGQKWGVRRFQNKDGSLTDQGKKRYSVSLTKDPKRLVLGAAMLGSGLYLLANQQRLADIGADWYAEQIRNLELNNLAVITYAVGQGLDLDSEVSGISTGAKQIKIGKELVDLASNQRISRDRRIES